MFFRVLTALILALVLEVSHASVRSEYEVKAAYLFNFTRFVTWPAQGNGDSNLTVCVYGHNPFGSILKQLDGRLSQSRSLSLLYPRTLSETDGCNVLFVGHVKNIPVTDITRYATDRHMLTVSEYANFIHAGGIIGFVKEGNVIQFEINLSAAQQSELMINSRLLELALKVLR